LLSFINSDLEYFIVTDQEMWKASEMSERTDYGDDEIRSTSFSVVRYHVAHFIAGAWDSVVVKALPY
jgi:hypothetical protein